MKWFLAFACFLLMLLASCGGSAGSGSTHWQYTALGDSLAVGVLDSQGGYVRRYQSDIASDTGVTVSSIRHDFTSCECCTLSLMKHLLAVLLLSVAACAQTPVLLDRQTIAALANELSGESAKRTVEYLALHHRTRGSRPLHAVAEHISAELRSYGITDVHIEQLAADGKVFYGTQRSRPGWDADFAELWLVTSRHGQWTPERRLGSWDTVPMTLAEDSESGDVEAELIDVGAGTSDKDYEGKAVRGKFILASAQVDAVQRVGVAKYGAAAIVSYAQNQPTAWSGENVGSHSIVVSSWPKSAYR